MLNNMRHTQSTAGETAIQIFNSDQFGTIRTAGTAEKPLFCLVDLCKALELTNPSSVRKRLDKEDVQLIDLHALNYTEGIGNSKTNFVTESGFYDVILQSSSTKVKPFRKWVTSEVLPSIRKSGGYIAARPDESPEAIMARALKIADETMKRQQAQIEAKDAEIADKQFHLDMANSIIEAQDEELASKDSDIRRLVPFADYARNAIESSTATYTMTDTADFLGFVRVSDFMDWTMQQGILRRLNGRWMPTAEYLGQGYFSTRVFRKVISRDYFEEVPYTVVTEAGRKMLFDRMTSYAEPTYAIAEPVTLIAEGGAL